MGILTFYWDIFPRSDGDYEPTTLSGNVDLSQIGHIIGTKCMHLKSVHTVFSSQNHGYIKGNIMFDFLNSAMQPVDCISYNENNMSKSTHPFKGIDMRWDGLSNSSSADVHLNLGVINAVNSNMKVTLQYTRQLASFYKLNTSYTACNINQTESLSLTNDPYSGLNIVRHGIQPMYVTLVFEYDDTNSDITQVKT